MRRQESVLVWSADMWIYIYVCVYLYRNGDKIYSALQLFSLFPSLLLKPFSADIKSFEFFAWNALWHVRFHLFIKMQLFIKKIYWFPFVYKTYFWIKKIFF